jgi:hypothetical protein
MARRATGMRNFHQSMHQEAAINVHRGLDGRSSQRPRPARPQAPLLRHDTTAPARGLVAMNGSFMDEKRVE